MMHEKLIAELEEQRDLPHYEIDTTIANGSYHNRFDDAIAALREDSGTIADLRAKLEKAEALSIKNIPFYRLSIHSLRDSINRLLWAYKHSEECERAKEENKTSFQPTCTCIDSDAIEYGAQTLFNTEQVAKAIEALAALKEGE